MSDSAPPRPSRLAAWLANDRLVAAALFGVALAVRAFHLSEIAANDPFFTQASVDGALYDEWARELLGGDWRGEGVLFLGPLYPLFLALVYSVFEPSLAVLKGVQALIGAGACVLVHGLTRELFHDRAVALLAGLGLALYDMHVFYGGTVMIVNLQVPLVLGIVWSALVAFRRPSHRAFALCGLLLGLSALARQTTLLMAPVLALWTLFGIRGDHPFARRFAWGTTFGLVILALILPFTVRNYVVGGDLVLLNSTGGANFYMGNQRGADGTWQVPRLDWPTRIDHPRAMRDAFTGVAERELGRTLRPSEVSSYWLGRGLEEIRADPGRWLQLELRKAAFFVNADEVWNNRSIEVSRRFSRVLRAPLPGFGLFAPLGLLGLVLTARRARALLPVYAALGAYFASALLFFVLSRYRLPAAVLLLPFAGYAAVDLLRRARDRDLRGLGLRLVGLGAFALLVHLPLDDRPRLHMAWYNLGNKYRELERHEAAIDAYRRSLAVAPGAISTHNNLALALEGAGRRLEAIAAWRRVGVLGERIGSPRHVERARRHLVALGIGPPTAPEPTPPPEPAIPEVPSAPSAPSGTATPSPASGEANPMPSTGAP